MRLACTLVLAPFTLALGCYDAHERNLFPIRDGHVETSICDAEGRALEDGPFSRRFGPYSPEESSRWLGGRLAWNRDASMLVASQDSWLGHRGIRPSVENPPSTEPILVFESTRSCLRPIAALNAPTEELGASLAVSASGNFIAGTGSIHDPFPGDAIGWAYDEPFAYSFERRGSFFVSRDPERVNARNLLQFVDETLAVGETFATDAWFSLLTLGETTSVSRVPLPSPIQAFVVSRNGDFAAIVDQSGRAFRVDLRGDVPRVESVGFAARPTGHPMAAVVADNGRIVVFHVEELATVTTLLDPGQEPNSIVHMGFPGSAASPGAVSISPSGDQLAWATERGGREIRRDLIVATLSAGTPPTWTEAFIQLSTPECPEPWNVRSVAFANDGRLAVGAACGSTTTGTSEGPRGALFVLER